MQLLVDFFPIIVFFVVFKLYGMYAATAAIIVAMAVQIGYQWLRERKVNNMLLISGLGVLLFGSATLLLHKPIFIQWKPTIVYWLFAGILLGSRFIGKKTMIERLMGHAIELPATMWRQLNLMWVANFSILGAANLYVVYHYDQATWVNFKLFGTLGLTLVTVIAQAIWIAATQASSGRQEEG
jgi:intracellular septation protein